LKSLKRAAYGYSRIKMLPHVHFLAGLLFGIVGMHIGILNGSEAVLVGVIAVLIDIDHFLVYIWREKSFDPRRFWNRSMSKKHYNGRTFIHHYHGIIGVGVLIVVVFLFNPVWGYILSAAYFSHMALDYMHIMSYEKAKKHILHMIGFDLPFTYVDIYMAVFIVLEIAYSIVVPM